MFKVEETHVNFFVTWLVIFLLIGILLNINSMYAAKSFQVKEYIKDLSFYNENPPYLNSQYKKAVLSLADIWLIKKEEAIYAVTSPNFKYVLFVTGRIGEWGFYGLVTYIFTDDSGNIMWQKKFEYGGMPKISNLGRVAIIERYIIEGKKMKDKKYTFKVLLIDKDGNTTGVFHPDQDQYEKWQSYSCQIHDFSPDNKKYYICASKNLQETQTLFLYCLNMKAEKIWKRNLEFIYITSILFNNSGSRIILDNFGVASTEFINSCYVFDDTGELIIKTRLDVLKGFYPSFLDCQNNNLIMFDEKTEKILRYDVMFGEFIGYLTLQDIADYLTVFDQRIYTACLNILTYSEDAFTGDAFYVSDDTKNMLKSVADCNDFRLSDMAKTVLVRAQGK